MTAGTRSVERNFLAPARRPNVRGKAVNAIDFIFLTFYTKTRANASLTGASAVKLKQRRH